MYTSLLLLCLLGADTSCKVEASKTFFTTFAQCEIFNDMNLEAINEDPTLGFYVADTACVGWGEEI